MALTKIGLSLVKDSFRTTVSGSNTAVSASAAADIAANLANIRSDATISGSTTSLSSSVASDVAANLVSITNNSSSVAADVAANLVSITNNSSSFASRYTNQINQDLRTSASPTFVNTTVTGTLTAQEIHTEFESASILFTSGSTIFGNSSDDIHNMTGSLNVSGAINLNNGKLTLSDSLDMQDNNKILLGTGDDFEIFFDGTNSIFDHTPGGGQMFIRSDQLAIDDSQSTPKNYATFYQGTGVVFNEDSEDHDFRVESNGDTHALFIEGGNSKVGIGSATPDGTLDVMAADGYAYFTTTSPQAFNMIFRSGSADPQNNWLGQIEFTGASGGTSQIVTRNSTTLALGSNNVQTLYITDDDRVGINTSNPVRPLSVSYGAAKTSTSTAYAMSIQSNESSNQAALQFYAVGGANAAARKFQLQTTEVGVANAGIIEFQPDGGVVSFANDVGIGTTNPLTAIHVHGDAGNPATSGTTPTAIARFGTAGLNAVLDIGQGASPYPMWIQSHDRSNLAQTYELSLNPVGGNVGIGTINPAKTLHVSQSDGGVRFDFGHDSRLDFARDSNGVYMTVGANQHLRILGDNGGNEIIRFLDNGNVGVGTTSPTDFYKCLEVYGTQPAFVLNDSNADSFTTMIADGGNSNFYFDHSGALRFLDATNPGGTSGNVEFVFNNNGTAEKASGAGDWASISDVRVKKNIEDLSIDALNVLNTLRPVEFNWKEEEIHNNPKDSDGKSYGFIADEIESILPQLVTTSEIDKDSADREYLDEDGIAKKTELGIMASLYIKAIQQLTEKNKTLEKRIEELEKK